MADDIVLEEESGDVTPTIYPEEVDITVDEVTIEHDSVTYEVDAGELPAEASTTAGVAKSPAGSLYPSYGIPTYSLKSAEVAVAGSGYAVNDILTIDLNADDAKLKVTEVTPIIYSVATATASGAEMTGYVSDETITVAGAEGDTAAVLTITAAEGVITALTVTTAGSFASDIAGAIDPAKITYAGVGTGATITVTTSSSGNGVKTVTITDAGLNEDTSVVENPVAATGGTGSGVKFNIVLG